MNEVTITKEEFENKATEVVERIRTHKSFKDSNEGGFMAMMFAMIVVKDIERKLFSNEEELE